jgi:hypothetical protein
MFIAPSVRDFAPEIYLNESLISFYIHFVLKTSQSTLKLAV